MLASIILSLFCINLSMGDILLDMSHDLANDSIRWPSQPPFSLNTFGYGYQEAGFWYESYELLFGEHVTTHIDAPSHFAKDGMTVDEIPLSNLMGPAIKIDISDKVANDSRALLTAADIEKWIENNGVIPNNSIIFVRTGWESKYGNITEYYGTENLDNVSTYAFPGIGLDAAKFITGYEAISGNRIVGVGIDTASMDVGNSLTYPTHVELYGNNIFGIENVANLTLLPAKGADVIVLPIKTRGGSGGPCRIVARIADSAVLTNETADVKEEEIATDKAPVELN